MAVLQFDRARQVRDIQIQDLRAHIAALDAELASIPPYEEWQGRETRERVIALADERHKATEVLRALGGGA